MIYDFTLTSEDIIHNSTLPKAQVYKTIGCDGGNLSPQLSWHNPPENTKSYAIICHDPDAPRANGWYHWLIINIPKDITSIPQGGHIEGSLETITDFGAPGYGGACPPIGHGKHRYNFTVYALDVDKINAKEDTPPLSVEQEVQSHAIKSSTITALYERK